MTFLFILLIIFMTAFSPSVQATGDNDTPSGASDINLDQCGTGTVNHDDDPVDWWVVYASESGDLKVTLEVPSGQDFDLELYNSSAPNGLLDESARGSGYDEEVQATMTYSGPYYIKIFTYGESSGDYRLCTEVAMAILSIDDFDCLNEPWKWGGQGKVDLDVYNSGDATSDVWIKIIASNDTILWDADDYIIHDWNAVIGPGEHWTKTGYSWTLPDTPYPNMPSDGSVYYYLHVGNPFDLKVSDTVAMRITDPPTISIMSGPSGTINYNDVTFQWQGNDIDGWVVGYEYELNGQGQSAFVTNETYDNLSSGSYIFKVRSIDNHGVSSDWAERSFRVNNPPEIEILNSPSGVVSSDSIYFEWIGSDSDGFINGYVYKIDGLGNSIAYTSISLNNLDSGNHSFQVQSIDNDGAESDWETRIFEVTSPPSINILSGPVGRINDKNVSFTWQGSDSDGWVTGYQYEMDGTGWTGIDTSANFNNLSFGPHIFRVRCMDNRSIYSNWVTREFTVNIPPTIALIAGPNGTIDYNDVLFQWQGHDSDGQVNGYEIIIDGQSSSTGYNELQLNNLSLGNHRFSVRSQDNDMAYSDWLIIDFNIDINTPPQINEIVGPSGTIAYDDVTFQWLGSDNDGVITAYEYKLDGVTESISGTQVLFNDLVEGEHVFEVRCIDDDGAWSEWVSQTFYIVKILIVNDSVPHPERPDEWIDFEQILSAEKFEYMTCNISDIQNGTVDLSYFECIILTNSSMKQITQSYLYDKTLMIYEYNKEIIELPGQDIAYFTDSRKLSVPVNPPRAVEYKPVIGGIRIDWDQVWSENLPQQLIGFIPVQGLPINAAMTYNDFANGNWGWGLVGVVTFGADAVWAITAPLCPGTVLFSGGTCWFAAGAAAVKATTGFANLFRDAITIEKISYHDSSEVPYNDIQLTIDTVNNRLIYNNELTVDCNISTIYDNEFGAPVIISQDPTICPNQVFPLSAENGQFMINDKYLSNKGVLASPPLSAGSFSEQAQYRISQNGQIEIDIDDNVFEYSGINGTKMFSATQNGSDFQAELVIRDDLNAIEPFNSDFSIDESGNLTTILSVDLNPIAPANGIVGDSFNLNINVGMEVGQGGLLQLKVWGGTETDSTLYKYVSGLQSTVVSFSVTIDEANGGDKDYIIYVQFRPYETIGPLDTSLMTDVVSSFIDYQIHWNTRPLPPSPLLPTQNKTVETLTPLFKWSEFQSGGDSDLQAGYQLLVYENGSIIYNTGFIADNTGRSHSFHPDIYLNEDPVTGEERVSHALDWGTKYNWDVRVIDSGGDWSEWGSEANETIWSFYTCTLKIFYFDYDSDGFGNAQKTIDACSAPPGYVADNTDCFDSDPNQRPGQTWYKDNDGDGYSDGSILTQCTQPANYFIAGALTSTSGDCNDGDAGLNPKTVWYKDADGDKYSDGSKKTQCSQPSGYFLPSALTSTSGDCNDGDAGLNPKTVWYKDADGDKYSDGSKKTQCSQPSGYFLPSALTSTSGDCNDGDAGLNPKTIWYKDADGDKYSDGSKKTQCSQPSGYFLPSALTSTSGDCNDGDSDLNPTTIWYKDADGDGLGDPHSTIVSCEAPSGYVADNTDCDDNDPNQKPGQTWYKDKDGDGYSDGSTTVNCTKPEGYNLAAELTAASGDCDDEDSAVHPGAAEVCNNKDDDCDHEIDENVKITFYRDTDNDSFGDPGEVVEACEAPDGYVTDNTDCDDSDPNQFPGQTWYKDEDGDGYSDGSTTLNCACPDCYKPAEDLTDTSGDCDDENAAINPGAPEVYNQIDDNCNNEVDETWADLAAIMNGNPKEIRFGKMITYRVVVSNAGPTNAEEVTVTCDLDSNLQSPMLSLDEGLTWAACPERIDMGNMALGDKRTFLIKGTVGQEARNPITSSSKVESDLEDPDQSNNLSECLTILGNYSMPWMNILFD